MIDIKNLSFGYSSENLILKGLSGYAEKGTITTLLGINGSGKSTLLRCINGLNKTKKGNIFIERQALTDMKTTDIAKKIAFVSQFLNIDCDITVRDYIVEGRTPHLKKFGVPEEKDYVLCESYASRMSISRLMDKNLRCLSGGEKQLVSITRALIQESPIILFDEPLSALDLRRQSEVLKIFLELCNEGKTIIFSSHNPNHAFLLRSNVWLINNGCLEVGMANDLLTEEKLRSIYGADVKLLLDKNSSFCELVF